MTKFQTICLKNRMLFYNMLTNFIGAWIVFILSFRSISPPFYEVADFAHRVNLWCNPILFSLLFLIQLFYEKPIRKQVDSSFSNNGAAPIGEKAKQRILNAPFFIMALNFSIWMTGAIVYRLLYNRYCSVHLAADRVFFQMVLVGLITTTSSFFVIEQLRQKSLVPHFFPAGGLYKTPNTLRIRISTRLLAFLFAVNLIPFISMLILVQGTFGSRLTSLRILEHLRESVVTNSLIAISIGLFLTLLMSFNFSRPLHAIIQTLKSIHEGHFDTKVTVTTNDEIGYTGDVINEMTEGLKERERMKHSLQLAKEVQLNLLPKKAPKINGIDFAGTSIYCDETGGDYYDYFTLSENGTETVGMAIGDVSDHGIHSALLMTTARAFIRFRSSLPGTVEDIVTDVNRHLSLDIGDGGQFMTLFFLSIDLEKSAINWVRAGHDPAILYDPVTNEMEELKGNGIPLGIDEDYQFQMNHKSGFSDGQILVLSTDGIWEARNKKGEIFGKERFKNLIRGNADKDPECILCLIVDQIREFQNGAKTEDDITMVVIKLGKNA